MLYNAPVKKRVLLMKAKRAKTYNKCPTCGAKVEAGMDYCPKCGSLLDDIYEEDEYQEEPTSSKYDYDDRRPQEKHPEEEQDEIKAGFGQMGKFYKKGMENAKRESVIILITFVVIGIILFSVGPSNLPFAIILSSGAVFVSAIISMILLVVSMFKKDK